MTEQKLWTGRRGTGLCHWKLACISVFLFSSWVRVSLDKRHKLHFISSLFLSFALFPSAKRMIQQQLSPQFLTFLRHTLHSMSPSNKNKQKTLRDWCAASPESWWLFFVSLACQQVVVVEVHRAWAEEEPLRTQKVTSTVFISEKPASSLLKFLFNGIQL